jgi:hypothetical protein
LKGLLSYLMTSRAWLSTHIATGSLTVVTFGYFIHCRTEFEKKLKENAELGELMNLIIKYRGTELESKFQEKYTEKMREMDSKSKYV